MRKYLTLIIGTLIVIAVIAGGYLLWQRLNLTAILFGPEAPPAAPAPEKLKALTEIPIFDYWVNKKSGMIYYLAETGQVIRQNGGTSEIVNSQVINRLNRVLPSPDGTLAIAKFNYPSPLTFSVFNTVTGGWQPLPANTIAAAWSPNSQEILYADSKALNILNLANQRTRKVVDLTQKDLELTWISDSAILLSTTPTVDLLSTIWSLNPATRTMVPLVKEENGALIRWSASGELGVKLHNQNRTPVTSIIDKNGTTLATLTFVTLPSKCLIGENKIYCAVPKNLREGLRFPDDYFKKAVYFDDGLYLIDLSSGSSKVLSENAGRVLDAEHLELHDNKLLFKNRLDNKLYSFAL